MDCISLMGHSSSTRMDRLLDFHIVLITRVIFLRLLSLSFWQGMLLLCVPFVPERLKQTKLGIEICPEKFFHFFVYFEF